MIRENLNSADSGGLGKMGQKRRRRMGLEETKRKFEDSSAGN
jgi:hypothetical protein